jgi:HEAT repeat protein
LLSIAFFEDTKGDMDPLPKSAHELFQRFWMARVPRSSRLADEQEEEILKKIGELRVPAAIPLLFSLLRSEKESARFLAATTIEEITKDCDSLTLAELVQIARDLCIFNVFVYEKLSDAEMIRSTRGLPGPLGILSAHPNGYTREAVVRALAVGEDGEELPFLLIRLNDWVPQVRSAAKQAVTARIRPQYAPHFARCLPLVFRLQILGREDHRPLVAAITELLVREEFATILQTVLLQGDRESRKLAFGLLVNHPHANLTSILTDALKSSDPAVRLWSARELRKRLKGPALLDLLQTLHRDRFMPIRREAIYGYAEQRPDLAPAILEASLLDPRRAIREAARFYLSKSGWTEFRTFYLAHLHQKTAVTRAAAIAGLYEIGKEQDAAVLLSFLQDPNARVRRAAVRAIGRLNPDAHAEQLLEALEDETPAVAKAARIALAGRQDLLNPTRLWEVFTQAKTPRSAELTVSLFASLQWWDSAPLLIKAAGTTQDAARAAALRRLDGWCGHGGRMTVRPTDGQLRQLEEAFHANRGHLTGMIAKDIETHIKLARAQRST